MSLFLGVDLGTSSVKLVILDRIHDHEVIESHSLSTNANVVRDGTRDEQCPKKILTAFELCIGQFQSSHLSQVGAIGVCGQMHGVLMWNSENGRPDKETCSNLVTWQDARCSQEFLSTLPTPSWGRIATGFGCATLMWYLKNDSAQMRMYSHAGTIMDFLVAHLTGNVVMSSQNAAGWGYFNPEKMDWDTDKLAENGFPVSLLPKVVLAGTQAGVTRCSVHNLQEGIPITAALGDLQCSTLASLAENKYAVLNIGTSSQIAFELSENNQVRVPDSVDLFPYFNGRWLAVAASLNGGNVIASFVDMLQEWMSQLGVDIEKKQIWTRLQGFTENTNDPMKITPALFGERHAPELLASAMNISPSNLKLKSVYQSLCQGLVNNLTAMMPVEFLMSNNIEKVIATGSVIEKNCMVAEQIRQAFHVIVELAESGEAASACGAALAARKLAPTES